jgi:hypothetical protein
LRPYFEAKARNNYVKELLNFFHSNKDKVIIKHFKLPIFPKIESGEIIKIRKNEGKAAKAAPWRSRRFFFSGLTV